MRSNLSELVTLKTDDGVLLDGAYYSSKNTDLGVLLVHGRGQNFYTGIVRWLAPHFSEQGTSSLALNMRDHDSNEVDEIHKSKFDIDAGVQFLLSQGCKQIILVGASYGSNKVALYVSLSLTKGDLYGVVLLSVGGVREYIPDLWAHVLDSLSKLETPILVIQGEKDEYISKPEESAREVLCACKLNAKSMLNLVPGADHGFTNQKKEVTKIIDTWLLP